MLYFTRLFAEFHLYCKKYREATLNIIMAMYYLHLALKKQESQTKNKQESKKEHPEIGHYRFSYFYKDVETYYKMFCDERYVKPFANIFFIEKANLRPLNKTLYFLKCLQKGVWQSRTC